MKTQENDGIVFTRDIAACSALQCLGFKLDPDLPVVKDEKGIATFFFLPFDDQGNSSSKALKNFFDGEWRKENPESLITKYFDIFAIRERTLDAIHDLSPFVKIQKGKYTIVVSPDASKQTLDEIDEFFGKGGMR